MYSCVLHSTMYARAAALALVDPMQAPLALLRAQTGSYVLEAGWRALAAAQLAACPVVQSTPGLQQVASWALGSSVADSAPTAYLCVGLVCFFAGLSAGLAFWPALDALAVARQWWSRIVREALHREVAPPPVSPPPGRDDLFWEDPLRRVHFPRARAVPPPPRSDTAWPNVGSLRRLA